MRPRGRPRLLPLAPLFTLAVLLGPVAAGLIGVLAPAFGYYPALGATELSLAPFRSLLAWPGLGGAVRLSAVTALASTALALGVTLLICAAWHGTRAFGAIERLLSPLLSVPHAAAALGLAFLISPSGWITRALSPWATGWDLPPDVLIVGDPAGFALIAGLAAKEIPFLLLMTLAALSQIPARRSVLLAQTQGYGRVTAWVKTVFPRVYPQIRLPIYAVLAFSASVVDVAVILGPSTPPPLSVQILRWLNDPDLSMRFEAGAGAVLQFGIVLSLLALWRFGELVLARGGGAWIARGARGRADAAWRGLAVSAAGLSAGAVLLAVAGLAVWSFAGFWSFPDALPAGLTLRSWEGQLPGLAERIGTTILIAALATIISLLLVLACLEAEYRHGLRPGTRALWLLYIPLIVPQTTFVTGLQTLAIGTGLAGLTGSVIAAHVVFVLPYVFLSLGDPFRAWDPRYGLAAATLGAGPDRLLWQVRLPMLLRPILTAAAVGFAVSVGQYLPTLLLGLGRVPTLTTEAVALSSGGDRRLIGVYAITQTAVPLLGFAAAIALPAFAFRNRKGLA
ncbi:ABC transporter permease subunit [Roseicyclus sp. F158]|uniref:ABC transporter permease subunit n=1 Tax=Tropicimonas omnivorans TaxID=3075590 RepID=A0ABU3DHL0_9RHOB|nr:ABC transporter permease subunit [Roseicyclus sp. F158]MDT0683212.1 ABC transporter permease subunit [Roseicyclus sp. F158]